MSRPASKFVKPLSESDRQFLEQTWRQHATYTVRCRAHAILLSSQGFTVADLETIFDISKPTALGWIDRWEQRGRAGLEDKPRPGGPPILDEEEQQKVVKPLIERFPRQPKKVIRAIQEETGKVISRATLRRIARNLGLRWKRFRRSQRKQRDERQFRIAIEEIEELRSLPDLKLAYFDEAAFSLQAIVPYGWQAIGERREVPVGPQRGNVQVLGIQEEGGDIYGYLHQGKVYGSTVAEVLDDYSQRIGRPTVLILDNASVHTCNLVADHMDTWNERGLIFYFLPPHSPELNAIERLWKKLKYQILPVDCWERLSSLVASLKRVFDRHGRAFLMPSLQTH
jgi:transposase